MDAMLNIQKLEDDAKAYRAAQADQRAETAALRGELDLARNIAAYQEGQARYAPAPGPRAGGGPDEAWYTLDNAYFDEREVDQRQERAAEKIAALSKSALNAATWPFRKYAELARDHYSGDFGAKVGRNFQEMVDSVGLYDLPKNLRTVAATTAPLGIGLAAPVALGAAAEFLPAAAAAAEGLVMQHIPEAIWLAAARHPKVMANLEPAVDAAMALYPYTPPATSALGQGITVLKEINERIQRNRNDPKAAGRENDTGLR